MEVNFLGVLFKNYILEVVCYFFRCVIFYKFFYIEKVESGLRMSSVGFVCLLSYWNSVIVLFGLRGGESFFFCDYIV